MGLLMTLEETIDGEVFDILFDALQGDIPNRDPGELTDFVIGITDKIFEILKTRLIGG